ncbi:phosphoglucomutase/phosphomannomutase, alpha/beta/alpha domain I [Oribacterium sp. oral taxon 078 str. F0262]|uniref:phospho-sugar mutase n=1 Tax=Oribacterium sp. oral taxon 078 TaxID=652706 RepID=UPI0001BCC069|nr:phospho-sugar mutase [Oribacterium sp. oral taxon 078]EFE93007.1 phosphoglucomutase/phosphomannomutase, alpha/beta/alpha domain I [Oribacterium sp. oral taxon 078 str. F0262]
MITEEYRRWLEADLVDFDLKRELREISGDEEAIRERFAKSLEFGTAGLRGTLGAGTNRMNIWVVRQATQGVADWVKTQGGSQTVAISYDSRLKGWSFARDAASVLAANGIKVWIYEELMPVPALSFATRYYHCNAGIMLTASHNPAQYNGYKAYGPDGCQMTDDAAAVVYASIQKTDVLSGAKYMSFSEGVEKGLIRFVSEDCKSAFYEAVESRQVRPGLCRTAGLKLVYSPLNGTGLVPVTRVLQDIGISDITIVPEQEYPNGYFTSCPYPNPEIYAALEKGLMLARETGADLMLATDPDADRVGVAVRCPDGEYELVTGNEMGVLLLDYIASGRIEKGSMPKRPVAVKSIVSTPLADKVAEHYGVELRHTLTGFKWIGDQILQLEKAGEAERFIFGFEESYGYLAGDYVRDKDAVVASMLICEMAAYYRSVGSSLKERLEELYRDYGRYLNAVDSFEFPGLSGMDKMASIMEKLRTEPPKEFAGKAVVKVKDYEKTEETGLPRANVLIYELSDGATVIVRPSGTEPKIKAYYTTLGKDLEEAKKEREALAAAVKPYFA